MLINSIKKKWIIFLLISPFLLATSRCRKNKNCPNGSHTSIKIINNSNSNLNWRLFNIDSVYKLNGAPYDEVLNSNQSANYNIRTETCWEEEFKGGNFMYLLIFHNDTVQSISWNKINGTNRGLLKKVRVDINYLNQNNFTVTYP